MKTQALRWGPLRAGWLVFVLIGSSFARGEAQARTPSDEFDVEWVPDLMLTAGMLGIGIILDQGKHASAGDFSCPGEAPEASVASVPRACDPAAVNAFDAVALGRSSALAAEWSDILLAVSMSAPAALVIGDLSSHRTAPAGERLAEDALVITQTYAAAFVVSTALKIAVRRLRPFSYDGRFVDERRDGDSRLSFPSGHTSMSFAGAAVMWSILDQRFSGEPWAVAASISGFAVAGTVGILRVLAGRHFPTDVLVGAAIGTGLGLLIPYYQRGSGEPSAASSGSSTLLGFGGRF